MSIIKSDTQHSRMYWQLSAATVLTGNFEGLVSFLWGGTGGLWRFYHLCVQDLSTLHSPSVILWTNGNDIHSLIFFSSPTLSSALRRISLSGKAPSRGIHWSRTSCGFESSSLTGTTRAPIGWSQALDNCTVKDALIMSFRSGNVSETGSSGMALCTHLHNEHLLSGVVNWEAERLIPLRGSGAITHLKEGEKRKSRIHFKSLCFKFLMLWFC